MNKLYKVKVETELMVMAENENSALEVAKTNAPNEISVYGKGYATHIKHPSEVPDDWKSIIPYSTSEMESRKCYEIALQQTEKRNDKKSLEDDEVKEIIKIKENAKGSIEEKEILPETRPDPKPKELNWHDTKSGRPLPNLRFNLK